MTIDRDDVINIASQLKMRTFTEEEIQEVINRFDDKRYKDPDATWDLIVENILYDIINSVEREFNFTYLIKHTIWSKAKFSVTASSKEEAIKKASEMYVMLELDTLERNLDEDTIEDMCPEENDNQETEVVLYMKNDEDGENVFNNSKE